MLQNLARRERQSGMEGRGGRRGEEMWRTAGGGRKWAEEVVSERVSAFQVLNSDLRISLYVFHSQALALSLSRSLCIKVQCCSSSDLYRPRNNYKSVCRRMQPSLPLFLSSSLFFYNFMMHGRWTLMLRPESGREVWRRSGQDGLHRTGLPFKNLSEFKSEDFSFISG